ncbi:H3 protein, partial [Upupa epops]|nr:H3 protein [Upupa epops]
KKQPPTLWKKLLRGRKKPPGLLPSAAFQRLVRSLLSSRGFSMQGPAVAALREGCEAQLVALLEDWRLCALHAKRTALQVADVKLARCLQGKRE